jgi:hypothetical protein
MSGLRGHSPWPSALLLWGLVSAVAYPRFAQRWPDRPWLAALAALAGTALGILVVGLLFTGPEAALEVTRRRASVKRLRALAAGLRTGDPAEALAGVRAHPEDWSQLAGVPELVELVRATAPVETLRAWKDVPATELTRKLAAELLDRAPVAATPALLRHLITFPVAQCASWCATALGRADEATRPELAEVALLAAPSTPDDTWLALLGPHLGALPLGPDAPLALKLRTYREAARLSPATSTAPGGSS